MFERTVASVELHRHEGNGAEGGSSMAAPRTAKECPSAEHTTSVRSFAERMPTPPRKRKAWQPGERDHLVYHWVRFEGKRQWWSATELKTDQATLSRILVRYEKWLAHGQPGADGQLDTAERQRVQRWLTYERDGDIPESDMR